MLFSANASNGLFLRATDGEIGSVEDWFFDERDWSVRYLVANTGMPLVGKKVLLSPAALDGFSDEGLVVRHTVEQIRKSPDIDTSKPVSRAMEERIHGYFGWPFYWNYPSYTSYEGYPQAPDSLYGNDEGLLQSEFKKLENEYEHQRETNHLRSVSEILGYRLYSGEEKVGKTEDLIIDNEAWAVRYLQLEFQGRLTHERVVAPVQCVSDIDYFARDLRTRIPAERFWNAPLPRTEEIDRFFEQKLFENFDVRPYWK